MKLILNIEETGVKQTIFISKGVRGFNVRVDWFRATDDAISGPEHMQHMSGGGALKRRREHSGLVSCPSLFCCHHLFYLSCIVSERGCEMRCRKQEPPNWQYDF